MRAFFAVFFWAGAFFAAAFLPAAFFAGAFFAEVFFAAAFFVVFDLVAMVPRMLPQFSKHRELHAGGRRCSTPFGLAMISSEVSPMNSPCSTMPARDSSFAASSAGRAMGPKAQSRMKLPWSVR